MTEASGVAGGVVGATSAFGGARSPDVFVFGFCFPTFTAFSRRISCVYVLKPCPMRMAFVYGAVSDIFATMLEP